jgi:hypothetical protein
MRKIQALPPTLHADYQSFKIKYDWCDIAPVIFGE